MPEYIDLQEFADTHEGQDDMSLIDLDVELES